MLPALGLLLLLPLAGALQRGLELSSNASAVRPGDSGRGIRVTRVLKDGELESVTRWTGLCAKETTVDWGDTEVALRQVWLEGSRQKLQLIYEGGTLSDCIDEGFDEGDLEGDCLSGLHSYGDDDGYGDGHDDGARFEVFDAGVGDPPPELAWLLPPAELQHKCSHVRMRARNQVMAQQYHRRSKRGLQDLVIAPGTKWCGPHQLASNYKELGAFDTLDRCCRRHDQCQRAIPPLSQRYEIFNFMPFTLSHCGCDQRNSDILSTSVDGNRKRRRGHGRGRGRRELLLVPGTQWCGRGHRATKYTNLGGFGTADACCRRHDTACPFYIPAFETRYGLFNWGISTVMHCACDERFRTCLKMAGTSSANFIGKLFFNVVQTKCFVLKPRKVCVRRSWYGTCEHHEYKKQAHLRNNVPY